MATLEAIAIRANRACDQIEAALGIELRRLHRNREQLRAEQLEAIADALAADAGTLQRARALLDGNWTKVEMEAALLGKEVAHGTE